MSDLPNAVQQHPACGACNGETDLDGDCFICDDCGLAFNPDDLSASFVCPDALPCGFGCANSWHDDHKIKPGLGYICGTCQLPSGHRSQCWTGCQPIDVAQSSEVST